MTRRTIAIAAFIFVAAIPAFLAPTVKSTQATQQAMNWPAAMSTQVAKAFSAPPALAALDGRIPIAAQPHVTWREWCPKGYHFCADFPVVAGSQRALERHIYSSGTSISGTYVSFESTVYVADSGHDYCLRDFAAGCGATGLRDQFYWVGVIHSKYTNPGIALSALNDWYVTSKMAHWRSYQGDLAETFNRGLYGGPGMYVYHDGLVYYLESADQQMLPTTFIRHFLRTLRFTS